LLAILHVVPPGRGSSASAPTTRPGGAPTAVDPGAGDGHDRALLMATSARFQWPSPRGFVSAYAQNLMAADTTSSPALTRHGLLLQEAQQRAAEQDRPISAVGRRVEVRVATGYDSQSAERRGATASSQSAGAVLGPMPT